MPERPAGVLGDVRPARRAQPRAQVLERRRRRFRSERLGTTRGVEHETQPTQRAVLVRRVDACRGESCLTRDFACASDECSNAGRRLTAAADERDDGGVGVSHWYERDVGALVVPGDGARHEADAATSGDQGDDFPHARARGRDGSGEAVSPLFVQPSCRCVVARDDWVDDEAFLLKVSELKRVASRERMRRRERDEARLLGQDLDREVDLARQQPRERDVDRSVDDFIDIAEQQLPNGQLRAWLACGEGLQHVRKQRARGGSVEPDGHGFGRRRACALDRALCLAQERAALVQQRLARGRQTDVAAVADEQRDSELSFESADLLAERWLRDVSRSAARPKCSSSATVTK